MLKKLTLAALATLLLLNCGGAARYHHSKDGASVGGRYPYGDTARVSYYADYAEVRGIPQGIGELTERQMSGRLAHYRFVYGGGKLRSVTFANSAGRPLGYYDHSKLVGRVSIMEFEYDGDGRLAATKLKNERGAPLVTYRWSSDDHDVIDLSGPGPGFCMISTTIDLGMFCNNPSERWINRFKLTRDARGYITRKEFWSDDGMAGDLHRVAGFDYALDSLGRPVTLYMLSSDGQRGPDANGVAGRSFEYDARGNIAKVVFFGGDNKPVLNEGGWAAKVIETDGAGNIVSETFHGTNGELVLNRYNYAKTKIEYDKRGYPVWQAFFGTDGKPALRKGGYAKITVKTDDSGCITENVYLGMDGKPVILPVRGFARMVAQCDERGNMTEQAFFGTDGNPIMHADGTARVVMKYDERGNMTERAFFDTDGNPVLQIDGVARITTVYDEHGNVTEEAYFGVDGEPTMYTAGYARVVTKYDERGNRTEDAFFGTDGKPVLIDGHYAKITKKYDARGNVIEEILYGTDGKPITENEVNEENEEDSGVVVDPASVVRDTLIDSRDNQTYRTVKIGKLTWMAENLNYVTDSSWCYDNADSNCVKYGRLYTWYAAMTACPAGWRLPDTSDWNDLVDAVGWSLAAKNLKSKTGWDRDFEPEPGKKLDCNGTDRFGFSAPPGGLLQRTESDSFYFEGSGIVGYWWIENKEDRDAPYTMTMFCTTDHVYSVVVYKKDGISVRCVRD